MANDAHEDIGLVADRIDNLVAGLDIPMPAEFHIEQLKKILPEISQELKNAYIELTGDNPWE